MNRMNKKGQLTIGQIVMLFTVAIVAIALIVPIFDTQAVMTSKQVDENKSVSTVTAYTDGQEVDEAINFSIITQSAWKQVDCPLTSVAIRNGVGTALTSAVDYTLDDANGRYSLLNTSKTIPDVSENITYVDYTYCADGYNKDSGARGIGRLPGLFAALALMAAMVFGIKDFVSRTS